MDSNQSCRIHRHKDAMEHINIGNNQRTNNLSRMVYTLNTDEESAVSLSRLPAFSSNGSSESFQLVACHSRGWSCPVHDLRKQLIGTDVQTPV